MEPTLQNIVDALQLAWGADTAYDPNDWSDDNRARGQCVVSSLVVQDYLGGELLRYSIDKETLHETHYVNKLDNGATVDTTASQYNYPVNMRVKPIQLDNFKSIREKRLADESTRKRYEILKRRVDRLLTKY
jgi:hypothetical protein